MLSVLLAVAGTVAAPSTNATRTAKITSASTYYDRAEGYAYFNGNVFVDDSAYQLHADRAYVFMDGTNELKRIVALGHVALTNENKTAVGDKAAYYRRSKMVVLSADEGKVAEVRERLDGGDRVLRGRKIRFWTDSRQVEVLEAEITAPTAGVKGSIGQVFGR